MNRYRALFALLVIILAGFALRTHQLSAVSLRGDEGFSAQYWAGLPLAQSLAEIATLEPHPPLTYALFRLWGISVGTSSETSLRLLPVLANTLGIALLYALALRLLPRQRYVALFAALLWAFHPYLLWHSQDFRNYAIWASLSLATLWLGLRLLQAPTRLNAGLYAVFSLSSPLFFYTDLLSLGSFVLWGMWYTRHQRPFLLKWMAWHIFVLASVALVFLGLQGGLFGAGAYGGNTGGFQVSLLLERFIPTFLLSESFPAGMLTLLGAFAYLLLGVAWFTLSRRTPQYALLLMFLALLPLVLLSLISVRVSIFNPRYILASLPAYLLSLSLATYYLWHRSRLWRSSLVLLGIFWSIAIYSHFNDPTLRKAPDWRGLSQFLHSAVDERDFVLQSTVDAAFGYYYPYPTRNKALPYHPQQNSAEILGILSPIAESHRGIWLIGQTPRDWSNYDIVPNWLNEHWQLSQTHTVAGFRLSYYQPRIPSTTDIEIPQTARFASAIDLLGSTPQPYPDGFLALQLYWQAHVTLNPAHKIFVHVLGTTPSATGSLLWAQSDFYPQAGQVSSTSWALNNLYRDVAELDLSALPAGDYELRVGWYNPENNQRLLLDDGSDAHLIALVSISATGIIQLSP